MHKIIASVALYTKSALKDLRMRSVLFCGDLNRYTLGPTPVLSAGLVTIEFGAAHVVSVQPPFLSWILVQSPLQRQPSSPVSHIPLKFQSLQPPAFQRDPAQLSSSLFLLSSSLLSKTLKEILNSPGGRTSGTRFSQLEKWSPDNYPWLWYFNLFNFCMVTLLAALGACNLDIF